MLPAVQPKRTIADRLDSSLAMRNEQNGDTIFAQLVYLAHAALVEVNIADRECFVDQQDFRIDMNRNRERQAHRHAA